MSNVEPFPVRRCRHYLDVASCYVKAEPTPEARKARAQKIIDDHKRYLTDCGVEPWKVERELRDLRAALSPPPQPGTGQRLRMAA